MKENLGKFDGLAFTTVSVSLVPPNHAGEMVIVKSTKGSIPANPVEEANSLIITMEDPAEKTENFFVKALGKLCHGSNRDSATVKEEMKTLGFEGSDTRWCRARKNWT